ncbi:related to putative haloacid dehalogenase-like hydrolase [Saccharomycodes ludwigii]|uniref:Related to putative haloacid dehalogenase-like hydrolase n=1 Tax=Saccharomycodes ludwigii TaxID=36035 RepID=A0A376B7X9_9ASCO|nr:hypothetical protein SCDLUD_003244 [Saccharomycodes ludwigii]KAH3900272.1 hypothetical protein SCDLUD_003244 [Saccharomycodes ludwigii]SSD60775.1 related to putative haloacid dehalogenase-like hydrolase [Saccharomycodes ludwigii]
MTISKHTNNKSTAIPKLTNIKGIVFDMDGTLCLPQNWMFKEMRQAVGLTDRSKDILQYIESLPTLESQKAANDGIEQVELKAMQLMQPQPGLNELMEYLTINSISKNICTRNKITPVNALIGKFIDTKYSKFDYILTRDFQPTKPSPEPLLYIKNRLDSSSNNNVGKMVMVGDSIDDMKSGRYAGFITILLLNENNSYLVADNSEHKHLVDYTITRLDELII